MWDSFPFSQNFAGRVQLNSSLSTPIAIIGDYLEAIFQNEFENIDHSEFGTQLRKINSTFSD
jgi:hypothetical protein